MEPFLSAKIKRDHAHIVLNPGDYIHHFYGGGIDVNKHFAEHHPEAVRAVFAGLSDAIVFIKHHPDRAAAIGARAYGYPKSIIVAGVRRYLQDDVWDLRTDWKAFDTVIAGMRQSGRLTHPVNIRELLDQQYLPKTDRAPTT